MRIDRELFHDLLARSRGELRLVARRDRSSGSFELVGHAVAHGASDQHEDQTDEQERKLGQARHQSEPDVSDTWMKLVPVSPVARLENTTVPESAAVAHT